MVLAEYNRKVSELEKEIRTHRNIMEALDNTISDLDGKNYECIMEKERLEERLNETKNVLLLLKNRSHGSILKEKKSKPDSTVSWRNRRSVKGPFRN